jgi:hypothetical protein
MRSVVDLNSNPIEFRSFVRIWIRTEEFGFGTDLDPDILNLKIEKNAEQRPERDF